MTMPQTRHYEMKDSGVEWIGKMPIGWKVIRNKALFEEVNERCGASPNLTLLSVSEYYGVAPRAEKIAEDEMLTRAESLEGYKICHKNDIVMNIMLAWKRSQGVSQYDGIVSPAYCVFRRKDDAPIDMRYIHYLIRTDRYADEYKCHSTGIIDSRLRLYPDKFLALESHVPPLSEQTAIAAYLDEKCATIDAIIAEAKATIDEYKAWKASVIFEAVTKGLNPNAEMKDSGVEWIGEIPRAWSAKRIKTLALSSRSLFTDGDWINSPDISEAGIRYFTTGNIGQGYFKEQGNGYITTETFNRLNCTMVHAGDLIISRLNEPIGRACIIPGHYKDCIVAVDNVILRPDDGYNKKYLMYCMSSDRYAEYTALLARGTTMHRISRTQLGNIFLPIPPSSEQAFIVSYLDEKCAAIDDVIAEKEELIGELENYKKSLIFEVVTGKRRVC